MNLEFREPANEAELKSLFDLRREVYSKADSLKTMVQGNDVSEFDLRAFHFGGFDDGKAIAYMRMVQWNETKFAPWVKKIADINISDVPKEIRFPFEFYCPFKKWNYEFLESLTGKKIGEAGKLAIHEDYRKDTVLDDFVKAFVVYCKETNRFDSGFGVCTFTLERYYKKLGFHRANGAEPFIHNELPEAVMLQFDRE